jgi:hypothetical protein
MKTRKLRLEFAPGARPPLRTGSVMLVLSAVLLAATSIELALIWSDNTRQARALDALDTRRSDAAAWRRAPLDPAEAARTRAMRQVAHHLAVPWADLLETLESAPVESVALLSVEPSVSKRSVRLTAETRNAQNMLAYLSALQRDARLNSVVLVSHQVQLQSPGTPVRFQIQAGWGAMP